VVRRRASSRWTGFATGAVLAVTGCALAAVGGGATSAAGLVPSLPPIPIPSISPLPIATPTPIPLPSLPLPTIPGVPLPTPTVPGLLPPPTPGLPGLPGASGSGLPPGSVLQPFLSPGSPWVPGGATGTSGDGVSAGAPPEVQTSVLGALLGLLGTPASVGVEQPSLEHFAINPALASGKLTGRPVSGGGEGSAPALVLWGVTIAILVGLMVAGMLRQHRRRTSRLRAVAAAPLVLLAAALGAAAAQNTWFPASPTGSPATVLVANAGSPSTPAPTGGGSSASALFNRLVGFETQVATTETALRSPSTSQGAAQLRSERSLAVSLEATLQQEYDFFVATAKVPGQAAELLQASATQPAAVRNAVTYDVQAVQAQLAQQAAIAQASQNNTVSPPALAGPAAAPPLSSGGLSWPLNGVITQGFGPSRIAIEPAVTLAGITYPHFHTGIDIAAAFETPVQAAADGVVALAGAETDGLGHLVGYGNYVVIAHGGGMITLYGHLEQVLVHPGQAVRAGDPIGLEGSTGNSTGPHVHFELRMRGVPTDPTGYVKPS
jgi:murein DD-endopeptidase MepM/ murein hydrolase activator NlpD